MLSATLAPQAIAAAAQLLKQSQFSQAQQEFIKQTVAAIAQHRC